MNESGRKVEPVAIVGIGCRFPGGANDVESFWSLLIDGRSGVRDVPPDRWTIDRFYHPDPAAAGAMVMRRGGFVDNLAGFDAAFWGVSPREALRMDPQQRWLLEVAWEAIEDAGIPPSRLRGRRVGVFVGISGNDYGGLQLRSTEDVDAYTNSGSTASIASNRISYMLDLKGPSLSLDTACSSSLVAVSAACESIWSGASEGALAGGVNALISPQTSVGFSKASMISPTGQCFAFDARANGFVRAEGAALVYLKPLSAALADRDRIYALIRSAVVNQDGHTSSMTVPSADGQAAMLADAYREAGIPPARVVYVEAHGTGTPVGDPIEATALGRVLGRGRTADSECLIGSVKTNIGHLESGSGIAGLIKAALVLHHVTIPATLNHEHPNPAIPFEDLRLKVVTRTQPLPAGDGLPPVVGVNSFGFGGTNAHAVLEAAPMTPSAVAAAPESVRPFLLPISARDDASLREYVKRYRDLLADSSQALADVCVSAGARKEHHPNRLVLIAGSRAEMRRRAAAWLREGVTDGAVSGRVGTWSPPVFVFAGQGPQWHAMGRQLLEREPVFRATLEQIDALIRELAGWSLLEEMGRTESQSIIDQTQIAQPAIFALQVGLVELWNTWGIRPAKVIGHSVGEVAAAYCAGVYSLTDAVAIITTRSRLQHTAFGGGRMLAVGLSRDEAHDAIAGRRGVELAAVNSPRLMTLAGDVESLEHIDQHLQQRGIFTRWLRGQYAFHSAQMDPIRDELLDALAGINARRARIPLVSTVTAAPVDGASMDAMYWWQNIRSPVLFGPAIADLIEQGDKTFLEVSPHPVLEASIKESLAATATTGSVFHSLRRGTDESEEMAAGLSAMHVLGLPIDWNALNRGNHAFVRLPHYPWSREEYWIESAESARVRVGASPHPLLGQRIESAVPTWQMTLDLSRLAYLKDHRIWNTAVFPAAAYGEIGLALARILMRDEIHIVENLDIKKALFIGENDSITIQVVFRPEDQSFAVYSSTTGTEPWELHAQGTLIRLGGHGAADIDLGALRAAFDDHLDHDAYCGELASRGYEFGPAFRQVRNVWRIDREVLTEIDATVHHGSTQATAAAVVDPGGKYVFHPAILDACFHGFVGVPTPGDDSAAPRLYLPQSIQRLHLRTETCPARLWAHTVVRIHEPEAIVADILVYGDGGERVADILGFRMARVAQKEHSNDLDDCYYRFEWQPKRLRGSGIHGGCAYPSTIRIAEEISAALPDVERRHEADNYYDRFVPAAEAVASLLAQRAFVELGWHPQTGDHVDLRTLMGTLGIVDDYRRVTLRLLGHFEDQGLLEAGGDDVWQVKAPFDGRDAEVALDTLAANHPSCMAEIELFRRTGLKLASVLTGESDALELLFPGGSHEAMERFYAEALAFPAHLELTRTAIASALASLPERRAIRVLEVGAGTGVLTRTILPVLPEDRTEYLFTDVGAAFVASARKQFADVPFLEYQVLDLEKDPQGQGIPAEHFDLILAADAVHATADVRTAVAHLRKCLAPGGLLMLLELVNRDFVRDDVTFGLLRGYSRFTDTDLRPYSALVEHSQWEHVLRECGFSDVRAVGCRSDNRDPEHAIVMGFAPAPQPAAAEGGTAAGRSSYVLFADETGVAERLAERLRAEGHGTVIVRAGERFLQTEAAEFTVRIDSEEDVARVIGTPRSPELAGVIHCWSLDHAPAQSMSVDGLEAAQRTGVMSAFRLVRALGDRPARIWFVTSNTQSVLPTEVNSGLAAAPLTGFARVANNEYECRFTTVDVESTAPVDAAAYLFDEVTLPPDGEFEIAYRAGKRHAVRLRRVTPEQLPRRMFNAVNDDRTVTPFRLQTNNPGILANLALHETRRSVPGPDEVEVRVRAAGINFRDVMKALGTHPGNPADLRWLGDDFAGTVERVGALVTGVRPGDNVAGTAPYAFRSYVNVDARMVFKLPARLSFEQATTIPTVFLTAHYALNHLARMQPGESILIHAGSGGVGLAAIQIARHLSLKIFSTAGTAEKRRLLTDMGVEHVSNSRTLDFADEIMQATGGRGVDAVLNSLAGDFIPKSLSVLAPFGRFLEIGKVDIYRNAKIGLHPLRNNISYFVIDLTQHLQHKPDFVMRMFAEIGERLETGDYDPIPFTAFPITEAVDAFRYMAQGKHVGKNVLTFDHPSVPIAFSTDAAHRFKPDATYLVTGGAGGFGLEVARWIAEHGGRHLVLMSRSGPRDAAAADAIEHIRQSGATVIDERGDVGRHDDVTRVFERIRREMPPLKGVFHAAMVLDDARIAELDERRFHDVLCPKMIGGWNLHTATEDLPLDHFVCFSSFSSVIGMLRQSNYNAGNAFLDALGRYRRARGLPALTINWGAILGAGFVDRNQKTADMLVRLGFGSFQKQEALRVLDTLLVADDANVAAARVDWQAVLKLSPLAAASATYASLTSERRGAAREGSLDAQLRSATADEQEQLLQNFIVSQVAGVFGTADDKISRTARLTDLGLDSLMTLELTNRVERELGVRIPMGALLSGPTIVELARSVRQLLAPSLTGDGATEAVEQNAPDLQASSHIVPIKSGEDIPVFCFHPVGGGVGIYGGLSPHLPSDLPLFGVESRLLRGADSEYETLDEMVGAYTSSICRAHSGPYRLLGFSLGGYVAASVAERLEAEGDAVEFVAVIDWDARQQLTAEAQRDSLVRLCMASYRFLQEEMGILHARPEAQLRAEISALVDLVARENAGGDAFYRWVVDHQLTTSKAFEEVARQSLQRFEQHCRLLTRGLPRPTFDAPLIVWRASEGFGSPLQSWGRTTASGREYVFEGDHNSLMRPAALRLVAQQLAEFLTESPGVDAVDRPGAAQIA